jgi:hypothetical protein
MSVEKNLIPESFYGKWFISKESVLGMTKSDDFDLIEFIGAYHMIQLSGDEEAIAEFEPAIKEFEGLADMHFEISSNGIETSDGQMQMVVENCEEKDGELILNATESDGTSSTFVLKDNQIYLKSGETQMSFVREKIDLLNDLVEY